MESLHFVKNDFWFETVDEGEIFLDNKLINNLIPSKRGIAMVFQSYALYPHMNVYENMSFGLKMEKHSKSDIEKKSKRGC